jgi:DnaJ-class molecular chaperone
MEQQDYYDILGVNQHATPQQIKEAYRKLAFQYHPDRNKDDPRAMERMKEINESYAVISDPVKRREYDALRERFGPSAYGQFRQTYSEQDIFRGSDINRIFEEMGKAFGLRGFEEIFRESYGPGYRGFEFRRPGFSGRGYVYVSQSGRGRDLHGFPGGGNLGRLFQYGLRKMWGIEWPQKGRDWYDLIRLEPWQAQHGGQIQYVHPKRSKKLMVKVPSGIREGQVIRLHGMGELGKGGAQPGDLYLRVRIQTPLLERLRHNLTQRWSSIKGAFLTLKRI